MERAWVLGMDEVEGTAGEGSVRARPHEMEEVRERLFKLGASALTDLELLSVLLEVGPRTQGLAESLLPYGGGLKALLLKDPLELCSQPRLGPARAAQLVAALELGRRAQRTTERRPRLRTPKEIHAYLAPWLSALRREVFHVLCFNPRNVLLADVRVAEGTMNTCPVDPREVYAAALTTRATAIVLAHNHPSGDPEPSVQDVGLTVQLVEAGRLLGIKVLDHLVLGDGAYVSLMERGLLEAEGHNG
ncbi:RadC family protein [Hyalangium rubrum]|uniref:DNA repair protein RadC n=1 Tax=Hyalangium rubrum TaxID=3103134 RepID=A0ABU5H778_9BACT|nr:DNA repair protein RadC [Hyalangium sp. s54d21]MDY7228982.1 DNA repair protein RadC [Hyalangium sp. s54d21]